MKSRTIMDFMPTLELRYVRGYEFVGLHVHNSERMPAKITNGLVM
jgi:hypothetical protein